jgi:hypothetical protein
MAHIGEELRLVLARFRELSALLLDFVEQPHVLDCDHRLVGKGGDKLDLLIAKGPYCVTTQENNANRVSFSQERYPQHGVEAGLPCYPDHCIFRIGLNVGDMNRFAFKQNSPGDRASVWFDGAIFHVLVVFPWCATTRDVKERRALWATDGRHIGLAKLGD